MDLPLVSSMCSCRHCPITNRGGFPLNITMRAGHLRVFVDIKLHRQRTRLLFSFITMKRMLSTNEKFALAKPLAKEVRVTHLESLVFHVMTC